MIIIIKSSEGTTIYIIYINICRINILLPTPFYHIHKIKKQKPTLLFFFSFYINIFDVAFALANACYDDDAHITWIALALLC